jgi:AcrR family transcriptional regulator
MKGGVPGGEPEPLRALRVVLAPSSAEADLVIPADASAGEGSNPNGQQGPVSRTMSSVRYPNMGRRQRSASSRRRKSVPRRGAGSVSRPVGPEDYFRTAFDILAERGPQALTTGHLCDRLKVTKGSFYYHFRNVDHFVEELADYRECLFGEIQLSLAAEPDPVRRLSSAINLAVGMPHEVEVAIRAWAHSNPVIGASQRRLDRDALSLVTAAISGIVGDPASGAIIGHQMLALLIGLQQLGTHLDSTRVIHIVAAFLEKTCRLDATMTTTDDTPTLELARVGRSMS